MPVAIDVENISKVYKLGEIGSGTLSQDLTRWYKMKLLGQEDPYLCIGKLNNRSSISQNEVIYSLRDINFKLEQGDSLGIMGKNGAGKSTLLKIISRITMPTTGSVKIKGKVTSLLEVGTGFHPDLTGRENIFLNGAILGMRKREIKEKLDQIIDFSEIGNYIDTPVRRYSSGMYVRLAFSVSAHLESDILILDEVLSVGDANFQKKCKSKIDEIRSHDGKTILFVSHSLTAVRSMCKNSILLENGLIKEFGSTSKVTATYLGIKGAIENPKVINQSSDGFLVTSFAVRNAFEDYSSGVEKDKSICVEVFYKNDTGHKDIIIIMNIKDNEGKVIFNCSSFNRRHIMVLGEGKIALKTKPYFLNAGTYSVDLSVCYFQDNEYINVMNLIDVGLFQVLPEIKSFTSWLGDDIGYLNLDLDWIEY